jgi:hypothetical protein
MTHTPGETPSLVILSDLLFGSSAAGASSPSAQDRGQANNGNAPLVDFTGAEWSDLCSLANSNHVIVRAFERLQPLLAEAGNDRVAGWAEQALQTERARIAHALPFLEAICNDLKDGGCEAVVIKSLDHWPDLGSDLDLYADGEARNVVAIMTRSFQAKLEPRSWGDRLANKWNFIVPGLPELVEVHVGRLGQTGEQIGIAGSLVQRSRQAQIAGHFFRVSSHEDRLLISTLQRMYRHFYIRLCDVADTAELLKSGAVNFARLRSLARSGGLWEGLATYLCIVADYVASYGGSVILLPPSVMDAARFGYDQVTFARNFLRIPILPHSASLYASELKRLLLNGELRNTLRLSLLPCLATAAALEFKFTGSDKGIW